MADSEKQTARRLLIRRILLIAFILGPLIEIGVLIQVGKMLGVGATLALLVLTAVIGIAVLRRQGLAVLMRAQRQLQEGGLPVVEVFEGFYLLLAGVLLITPGFVSDVLGILLLLRPVRLGLYRLLGRPADGVRGPVQRPGPAYQGMVVEGQFEEVDPKAATTEDNKKPMPQPRGSWDRKA